MFRWLAIVVIAVLLGFPSRAEAVEIRIAKQFGIPYLPIVVMEREGLLDKRLATLAVRDTTVKWMQLSSANAMNDALLSGNLDFASGGPTGLAIIWDKTKGRDYEVKAVATMNEMPLYLITLDPRIKTIKDFKSTDRIAAATARGGFQYVIMQMAAEKMIGRHDAFDHLFVSIPHPDAMNILLTGKGEITAHFGSPPFQYQELEDPRARIVLDSFDALGGPTSISIFFATKQFHSTHPRLYGAVLGAMEDAMDFINANPDKAAKIYIEAENSKLSPEFVKKMLTDPKVKFTTTPLNIMQFADFMYRHGMIQSRPASWKDLFFPEIHSKPGS